MLLEDTVRLLSTQKIHVFSLEDLCAFYPQIKHSLLVKYLFRWKQRGWIVGLRKGLYELCFPNDLKLPDLYLANKIYSPSYVSLETALSHYNLIPEVAIAVTSVTTKVTRQFKNQHGLFIYRSVQPRAFCGYYIEQYHGYNVLLAEPEKALVDYLYFNTLHKRKIDLVALRLDYARVKKMERHKMELYAELYHCDLKEILSC